MRVEQEVLIYVFRFSVHLNVEASVFLNVYWCYFSHLPEILPVATKTKVIEYLQKLEKDKTTDWLYVTDCSSGKLSRDL